MVSDDLRLSILKSLSSCVDFGNSEQYYETLCQISSQFNQDQEKLLLIDALQALGDRDRFLIVDSLRTKDRCVCELEAILQKSQPAVSHHLKILENAQLIKGWKKGKFTHYSLLKPRFDQFMVVFTNWINEITNYLDFISINK